MKNPEQYPPFLSEDELEKKTSEWSEVGKKEKNGAKHHYTVKRIEGDKNNVDEAIENIHAESFIEYISELIERIDKDPKQKGRKIMVLDVGGGSGVYAEQLRNVFGDRIRVFTTGLAKRLEKEYRKDKHPLRVATGQPFFKPSEKMHPDDLKWRSILQLHDFPEFDLILDTYGEQLYGGIEDPKWVENKKEIYKKYLIAVISKLKTGGKASIAPCVLGSEEFPIFKDELEKKYGIRMEMVDCLESLDGRLSNSSLHKSEVLKIEKIADSLPNLRSNILA